MASFAGKLLQNYKKMECETVPLKIALREKCPNTGFFLVRICTLFT